MARRERHLLEVRRIPRAEDNAAIVWICLELMNYLGKLVNALVGVVFLRVNIFGAKVSPLKTIDGPQISNFAVSEALLVQELTRAVAVPNLDTGLGERDGGRRARDEPEKLADYGTQEDPLGRQ